MTWLVSWPISDVPQYAEHPTEAAAEAHAKELRASKRGQEAVVFWVGGEGAA